MAQSPETVNPGQDDRARLLRMATTASVATACVLIAGKLVAWLLSGSVSVLASLVDSLMDAAASILNFVAVRYSLMPADAEHRFGHGKAESLAGLAQAAFITGSAVFLILQAVDRLLHPRPLEALTIALAVMVFATVATAVLLLVQRHVIRRTASVAIRADSLHYATDLLTNLTVIAALVLAQLGWPALDPVLAIIVAAYILYSAVRIGIEAIHALMDRELPEEVRTRIREIALGHPLVRGVHDLRTRQSGQTPVVQLHLELEGSLSLAAAHEAADQVENAIRESLPGADVIAHQDVAQNKLKTTSGA
jgi:ferrous-iron efflux pump FieF